MFQEFPGLRVSGVSGLKLGVNTLFVHFLRQNGKKGGLEVDGSGRGLSLRTQYLLFKE